MGSDGESSLMSNIAITSSRLAATSDVVTSSDQPAVAEFRQRGQCDVLVDAHVHDQALLATVLWHEAEDRPGDLAAAGADQSGERDDLTLANDERHIGAAGHRPPVGRASGSEGRWS